MPRYLSLIILSALTQVVFSVYYAGQIEKLNQLLNSRQALAQSLKDKNLELQKSYYQLTSLDILIRFQIQNLPFPIKKTINPLEENDN